MSPTPLGWVAIAAVTLPALLWALWPLLLRRQGERAAPGPGAEERRLELAEQKAAVYRALRELDFDHEAGHLSDDDWASLRARYEARAARVLRELDALGPAERDPRGGRARKGEMAGAASRGWTRHPVTLAAGAVALLAFGAAIGINAARFTEPDRTVTPPGSRVPVTVPSPGPAAAADPSRPIPPEMLAGMLRAARQSLAEGRYAEAIAAYQAVLKRDARNVDALTHLGLIVAIGGHADTALETFDKALAIDPDYPPAHLYRGQVLYEVKKDYPGAARAWERFLQLVPSGTEHDRVAAMLAEARAKQGR
jgi:tetratricopeptide (TPR) repeat protein